MDSANDLRFNIHAMEELKEHIRRREGAIPYFYCDDRGLVTIGVGYLVDTRGSDGETVARRFARMPGIQFFEVEHGGDSPLSSLSVAATPAEIVADWKRVKDHGRGLQQQVAGGDRRRMPGAAAYARIAQLRLSDANVEKLFDYKISEHATELYTKRPFMLAYDALVAGALVDVRFNPAAISLYSGQVQEMWDCFNPGSPRHNPERAMQIFYTTWILRDRKNGPRYGERHWQRLQIMMQGMAKPRFQLGQPQFQFKAPLSLGHS